MTRPRQPSRTGHRARVSALIAACAGLLVPAFALETTPAVPPPAGATPDNAAGAVPTPPAPPVADPAADALLDAFIEAMGGEAALTHFDTRITHAELSVPSAGITVPMTTWQKSPNFYLTEQTMPGVGKISQGYDGTIAWAYNSFQGYRELEGAERTQLLAGADMQQELNFKKRYPGRTLKPDQTIDGHLSHVVLLSGNADMPDTTCYFDAESHLLVRIDLVVDAGDQGQLPTSTVLSDYKEVDGMKLAHHMTIHAGPIEMQTQITKLENGVNIDDAVFAPQKPKPAAPGSPATPPAPAAPAAPAAAAHR